MALGQVDLGTEIIWCCALHHNVCDASWTNICVAIVWQAAICASHFVGKHFSNKLFMKDSKTRFFHHTESATKIRS